MDVAVICVPTEEIQPTPVRCAEADYRAFASNLKRSSGNGRLIGSFDLYIPCFDLHLRCSWLRDDRGRERIGMPRVKVEAPDGKIHLKTLARWHTAQSEDRFQRAALRALHQLVASTEAAG